MATLQLWTDKHSKFFPGQKNFFEQEWTSKMDSADQNTPKTAFKKKILFFFGGMAKFWTQNPHI